MVGAWQLPTWDTSPGSANPHRRAGSCEPPWSIFEQVRQGLAARKVVTWPDACGWRTAWQDAAGQEQRSGQLSWGARDDRRREGADCRRVRGSWKPLPDRRAGKCAGGRFFEDPPEGTDEQIEAFAGRCRELLGTRPALVDGKPNELDRAS